MVSDKSDCIIPSNSPTALTVVPEEAEIVRRIFHSYVNEKKGCHTIANELNAAGLLSIRGKMWRDDTVNRIIQNDKYVGDLTQWKHYTTDFLTKMSKVNRGEVPLVHISNHHEGIIDRETWNRAKQQNEERGALSREGRKHSSHYWYSSKVFCGECGYTFNVSGKSGKPNRTLHCVNRAKYGANARVDANGAEVGCDSSGINERVLEVCMENILEHIQSSQEEIVADLLIEIKNMQKDEKIVDLKAIEAEIEKISRKKSKAIDLMLEDLITKDDLKRQTALYDSEIARLTEEISQKQNINAVHENQLNKVRAYIDKVKKTAEITEYSTKVFGELLARVVVHKDCVADFYLNCVPFGFRISYHIKKFNKERKFLVFVDSCAII